MVSISAAVKDKKMMKFIPRSFVSKQVINVEEPASCSRKDCEEKTCGVVNDWFLD